MASFETVFLPVESPLQIEQKETPESTCKQEPGQSIVDALRAKAKIFSDPFVRLHRIDCIPNPVEVLMRTDDKSLSSKTRHTTASFDRNSKKRKLLWSSEAKCPICDKRVVFLRKHMETHKAEAIGERGNGRKTLNSPEELTISPHPDDGKVTCRVCQRKYTNMLQLRKHCRKKRHALPEPKINCRAAEAPMKKFRGPVTCGDCGKELSCISSLNRHIDKFHKNTSNERSKTDCESKPEASEESTGQKVLKDKADKACNENLAAGFIAESHIFAENTKISRTETEHMEDAAETVRHELKTNGVPSFEEALMYIELLTSYCSDKLPDGINHLRLLKTMLEQQHFEESNKILQVLPTTAFDDDEWESIDDPLESENDHFSDHFMDSEALESEAVQEDVEKVASHDGVTEPDEDNFSREDIAKYVRIVGLDDHAAILARKENEVLGHLNNDEILMTEDKQPETAEALAVKGNGGLKPSDPHTCCVCLKVLRNRESLKRHLKVFHVRSKAFVCDFCPKFYFDKQALKHHMMNHSQKVFACAVCDYKTPIKHRFEEHVLTHAEKVECPICNKPVSRLKQHIQNTHEAKKPCPICQKMLSKNTLKDHLTTHEKKIYICEKCSECFESKLEVQRHNRRQHQEGYRHVCHCGAAFKAENGLKSHQKNSHGKGKKTCEVCQKECTSLKYFKQHWKKKHQQTHGMLEINRMRVLNRIGPFTCDRCGSKAKTRESFRFHNQKKHKTLFCDLCPRKFFRKSFLIDHMRGDHLNLRAFNCKVCSHRSFSEDDLKKHMMSHGPKTECNVCHKFVLNIYSHSRSHMEVICAICHKTCSKENIARHIRVHAQKDPNCEIPVRQLKERKYKPVRVECPICQKLFTKSFLEYHLRMHKPQNCKDCVETFDNSLDLARHILTKHCNAELRDDDLSEPEENSITRKKAVFPQRTEHERYKPGNTNDPAAILALKGNEGIALLEPHTCCLCRRVLVTRRTLRDHLNYVHKVHRISVKNLDTPKGLMPNFKKNKTAELCLQKFPTRKHLKVQLENYDLRTTGLYCDLCPKRFFSKNLIEVHMKAVHITKSLRVVTPPDSVELLEDGAFVDLTGTSEFFKCGSCELAFKDKSELERHKHREHSGKINPKCHCGAVFASLLALDMHQEIHANERVTCDICHVYFSTVNFLNQHYEKMHKDVLQR